MTFFNWLGKANLKSDAIFTFEPNHPMNEVDQQQIEQNHWNAIELLRDMESTSMWEHVFALRRMGTISVLEKALSWCSELDPFRRSIGVLILSEMGDDGQRYSEEAGAMIRTMIQSEQDQDVITSLISAVNFREIAEASDWLISLANHPDEDVRWRVAWGLPIPNQHDSEMNRLAIETLIRLSVDSEPSVREWATFSLSVTEEDSPNLREALLDRMKDPDFNTRSEAAIGLARRKELRGIPLLVEHLKSDRVGELYLQAAEIYADPKLKPALVALKRWWNVDPDLVARAIAACS